MSKQREANGVGERISEASASHADWHPYSVWRKKIRSHQQPTQANDDAQTESVTGWDPYAVWKEHIKRA